MNILDFCTRFLDAFAEFFHCIIDFIKICYGLIVAVFYKSLYIFRIVPFEGTGGVILHCRLKLSEQLLIINNVTEVLRIIVQTVHTADCLKQSMILHFPIDVQVGARRRIKSGKQFVHNNKKLHVCRLFYKLPFCLFFEFFNFGLNWSCVREVSQIKTEHLKISIIFQKGFGIVLIANSIRAQFTLVRCIRRYNGAFLKAHLLKNFIILAGSWNGSGHKDSVPFAVHQTRLHIEVLNNVPCYLFKTRAGAVYLLHRTPFLFQFCLCTGR